MLPKEVWAAIIVVFLVWMIILIIKSKKELKKLKETNQEVPEEKLEEKGLPLEEE